MLWVQRRPPEADRFFAVYEELARPFTGWQDQAQLLDHYRTLVQDAFIARHFIRQGCRNHLHHGFWRAMKVRLRFEGVGRGIHLR